MTDQGNKGVVGFIGLGTMGLEMARNLLKAGHPVRAYDVVPGAIAIAVADGASAAASVAEAADGADLVITMLPDTPQVEEVVLGPGGLLENPPAGRLIADMSTISPVSVRRMHALLRERGIAFVDAPVSGGPGGRRRPRCRSWSAAKPRISPARSPILPPWAPPSSTSATAAPARA